VKTLDDLYLTHDDALFLDFDGTLVDFGPDPATIWLEAHVKQALESIAQFLDGALCIISGRDLRDLALRVPESLWRAGGHGLDIIAPSELAPADAGDLPCAVLSHLRKAEAIKGVRLEMKGPVAALHYREAPEAASHCLKAATEAADQVSGYVVMTGKNVVEVKPNGANKGAALRKLMARTPFDGRRPIMLGDDTTDEDAMREAQEIGGLGVKVGAGESIGQLRAHSPAHVHHWLNRERKRPQSSPSCA
jgi:trehalose 6-phosphate phosphatase